MSVLSRTSYRTSSFIPSAAPVGVSFPSDVDDTTWELIAPVLAPRTIQGRPRVPSDRLVYNAILHVLRGGIAWRMLPKSFPPWQTVYGRFAIWADNGPWQRLADTVRQSLRIELGREAHPSTGIIDSQSVATGPGAGIVGNDAGKKVRGRKRHLLVNTEGFLVTVVVTPANVQNPKAAFEVLAEAKEQSPRLSHVWGDGRYRGQLFGWVKEELGITLEIVSRARGRLPT